MLNIFQIDIVGGFISNSDSKAELDHALKSNRASLWRKKNY